MTRLNLTIVTLGSLLATGCVTTDRKTLASGGTPLAVNNDDGPDSSSGDSMDDTGMSGGEGYPPIIESASATWAEDQNGGWYIEASITYSDQDDDVRDGGMVGVTLVVDDETYATEWLAIDGVSAIHEDSEDGFHEIRFNPQPPDVTDPGAISVEATLTLKDAQTNRSNEYPITPS